MPSRKIEQQLDTLSALKETGATEAAVATLRKALTDRVNLVVAKAAGVAAHWALRALIPNLVESFHKLLDKGAEADPQCWGKNALAKALKDLGHDESGVFLRGLECVQMEPIYRARVDTAGTLRGICVLALLQCADLTRDDKLWHQMRALTDAEAPVRLEAARALEEMDGREAALLLRLKARMGDQEASVTGQALASLLAIEREAAVRFVAEFLNVRDEQIPVEAALALGTSRLPAAVQLLLKHWSDPNATHRQALLRAISASRQEEAFRLLLDLVRDPRERYALAALDALALHRDSAEIRARIAAAVAAHGEASLTAEFRRLFPAD